MKQLIRIIKNNQEIFNGKIADIPIKNEFIIKKSIELFDDDEPCIIHQSYVYKEYVDILLSLFKKSNSNSIFVKDYLVELDYLDFTELEQLTIILKG